MDTPNSIKIGAQIYKVVERHPNEDGTLSERNYGYTIELGNLIVIDSSQSLTKKQVTLMHELMHAIILVYCGYARPPKEAEIDEWEHYFIGLMEGNLLCVLKDNPKLLQWLGLADGRK